MKIRGWRPEVAGRTRTIPAPRRPDRYLGVPGSERPHVATTDDRCALDNDCLRPSASCGSIKSAPEIASSPAVSEPLIDGSSEPPAGAAGPELYISGYERAPRRVYP
ncbi:hypothetical protein T05_601 [Trichinella murrelli]|uniref:Uncharacterized protein n=1 Tax=Trichinella murrelli TaxID=144512 RepID=A0A0V0U8Y9_9BILA|nr:hypothetical protein T05_601 [Trichinella murrelli]